GARVIVSEINEERLKVAKELGADVTVNPAKDDITRAVHSFVEDGVDVAIVTIGNKAAIESVFPLIARGARIAIFASTHPSIKVEIDPNILHYSEPFLTGSYDHMPENMYRALQLMDSKRIDVTRIITHVLPLDKLAHGFNIVKSSNGLKVQISP
ncbi:MAG: zinc-binding dehydrogenase, partial [Conexivisphaerales archaeon]